MNSLLKEYIKSILSELIVKDLRSEKDDSSAIFVYKENIWFLEPEVQKDQLSDILSELLPEDILKQIENEGIGTDWLFGYIDDDELFITATGFNHHPKSSMLVKKIVNQFDLDGVHYEASYHHFDSNEDLETYFVPQEIQGKLPEIMFHGTTYNSLKSIEKVGLRPGGQVGKTNWSEVTHYDAVSLTSKKGEARFHAANAAARNFSTPIVLFVKIPDPERIMADYDVDKQSGRDTYQHNKKPSMFKEPENRKGRGSLETSIDVGTIGYKGRIPPKFIVGGEYFDKYYESWRDISEMDENMLEEALSVPTSLRGAMASSDFEEKRTKHPYKWAQEAYAQSRESGDQEMKPETSNEQVQRELVKISFEEKMLEYIKANIKNNEKMPKGFF